VGKYHLKADIYATRQRPGNYIPVKVADSRPKRKNTFVNPRLQNLSFFAVGAAEELKNRKISVIRNP